MTKTTYRIAVYPGDGIGPEVIEQTVRLLRAVEEQDGTFQLDLETFPWGFEYWQLTGKVVPDDYLDILRPFDAILLGAVGWPQELSDHITLAPLVRIRQAFDQYACVRPARLFPGLRSVLADKTSEHIDLVVIRENSEGVFAVIPAKMSLFKQPFIPGTESNVSCDLGLNSLVRDGII